MKIDEIKVSMKIEDLISDHIDELKEYKAKQKGELTPKQLTVVLLNELITNEIEDLIIIRRFKDDVIATGWTLDDAIKGLGMADILKMHIADEIE